ncbi:MAG: hypothetical protein J0H08_14105 [Rhizobiales bacterium]|nr:hypothetical protein [Hyphomicrobiales bacterium]
MAFKPNYQQERNNRNRAKEQKKQEKLRRLQEASAERRKDTDEVDPAPAGETLPETEQNKE